MNVSINENTLRDFLFKISKNRVALEKLLSFLGDDGCECEADDIDIQKEKEVKKTIGSEAPPIEPEKGYEEQYFENKIRDIVKNLLINEYKLLD